MTGELRVLDDPESFRRFWELAIALKRLRRQGWIDRGVDRPESVADHSWGVALLAWLSSHGRDDLNRERILLLGLVHDLPEALAGDATPFDEVRDRDGRIDHERFREIPTYSEESRQVKKREERRALAGMIVGLPEPLASDIQSAWIEYDEQQTPEARYVREVDKLETLLQARAYALGQPGLVMDSFFLGADVDVLDRTLRRIGRLDDR